MSEEQKDKKEQKVIINATNISFKYKKEYIFRDISCDIHHREFLGIIGPNGGGKSTFVKILLGILKVSSGKISYPSLHLFSSQREIGYVPQNTQININFPITALEVVEMGFLDSKILGFSVKKKQREIALENLERLGILHLAHKKIGELSGGERQRVLIARAICGDKKLLILDEPTSNIDTNTQKEIYKILKNINNFHTIIAISHDIPITLEFASRILYINKAIYSHDVPKLTLNSEGHICEIDIFQDLANVLRS